MIPRMLTAIAGAAVIFALAFALADAPGQAQADEDPIAELRADVDAWHAKRIASLRRPDGWLSLVGLYALPEGRHRLGSGSDQDLSVPARHPAHIGVLEVAAGTVTMVAAPEVDLRHGDQPVTRITMVPDTQEGTTELVVGELLFYVIERDGKPYLRVKDRGAPLLEQFEGIERWPVRTQWRVEGRWVPYASPKLVRVPNILGTVEEVEVQGAVEFELEGHTYRLDPTSADESLFFVFGDATNGVESYGAGRFLYAALPDESGHVVLDFNRSYNPPCVFTPFATCPLPPEGNELPLEITAGEKMWGAQH